jgi:hypothetical protein
MVKAIETSRYRIPHECLPDNAGGGFTLNVIDGVCDGIRRTATELCERAATATRIAHGIRVVVAPAIILEKHGGRGFAAFLRRKRTAEIWLAGMRPPQLEARHHALFVAHCFAHELVHYEQWRDGKCMQERGVEVRLRTLLRRMGYEENRQW